MPSSAHTSVRGMFLLRARSSMPMTLFSVGVAPYIAHSPCQTGSSTARADGHMGTLTLAWCSLHPVSLMHTAVQAPPRVSAMQGTTCSLAQTFNLYSLSLSTFNQSQSDSSLSLLAAEARSRCFLAFCRQAQQLVLPPMVSSNAEDARCSRCAGRHPLGSWHNRLEAARQAGTPEQPVQWLSRSLRRLTSDSAYIQVPSQISWSLSGPAAQPQVHWRAG